jgi:TRAP-type C4-dicarboxylate transport system permease small subunit
MKRIWSQFNDMLAIFSGFLLGLAMIAICIDICARAFFNSPIIGVVDLVTVLIPIFVFLPMADTEIRGAHIRVELIASLTGRRWGIVFDFLDSVCGIVFLGFMAWVCWGFAVDSWQAGQYLPGIWRIRVWPSKFAMAIGAALFAVQILINGAQTVSKIRSSF